MRGKCSVEGCGREHYALGFCSKHYKRLKSGDDPNTPSRLELSVEERFRSMLGPQDPVTGCIEWTGSRHGQGYGLITVGGKLVRANRLAWELKHGPIPAGLHVLHECDNPPCCNDAHLFLGTAADNSADKDSKGRGNRPKGSSNGNSKLVEKDVVEILRLLAASRSQRSIANEFGISQVQVGNIKRGEQWAHLTINSKPS
jgi:hypothetical protein